MVDEISLAISLTSVFLSVLGLLYEEFKSKVALEKRIATLEAKGIDQALIERIARMEVKMDLFWKTIEQYTIKMLKHPTAPRLDELLDKLSDKTITLIEMEELKKLLECEIHKKNVVKSEGRVLAMAMTIARIDTLLVDLKGIGK